MRSGGPTRVAPKFEASAAGVKPGRRAGAAAGSLLVTSRVASFYDAMLPRLARGTLADLGAGDAPLRPHYDTLVDHSVSIDWPGSGHDLQVDVSADLNGGVPLRARAIDTVLVSDVLEHLAEAPTFLEECARILRPGGVLVGNVPFLYGLHEVPHDYYRFTEYGLRHLLERAGFHQIEISNLGGGGDVLVDILCKCAAQFAIAGPPVAVVVQRSWLRLSSHGHTVRPGRLRRKFPLAYGFVAVAG